MIMILLEDLSVDIEQVTFVVNHYSVPLPMCAIVTERLWDTRLNETMRKQR